MNKLNQLSQKNGTKSIHLEATSDLSTTTFLSAFQRFVSRVFVVYIKIKNKPLCWVLQTIVCY